MFRFSCAFETVSSNLMMPFAFLSSSLPNLRSRLFGTSHRFLDSDSFSRQFESIISEFSDISVLSDDEGSGRVIGPFEESGVRFTRELTSIFSFSS